MVWNPFGLAVLAVILAPASTALLVDPTPAFDIAQDPQLAVEFANEGVGHGRAALVHTAICVFSTLTNCSGCPDVDGARAGTGPALSLDPFDLWVGANQPFYLGGPLVVTIGIGHTGVGIVLSQCW